MPGAAYSLIAEIAADQHGYVTQQDASAAGVSGVTLARMAQRGTLERASRAVYRVPLIPPDELDEFMRAALWPRGARGVMSHQTALELHGLSDVNPSKIHLTVPRAHRVQREIPAAYVLHREDLDPRDLTAYDGIPIVTPMWAVLQAHAAGLGPALIAQAIQDGRRKGLFSAKQAADLSQKTAQAPPG